MSKGYHKPKSLARRQKAYDEATLGKGAEGFTKPGSLKK